ncbi:ubiquitin-conjugating enzyme/RWD-like protein [Lasiosphaeris hirsuta]|uniref:Ubiquitin-conjugating enzyme/RWD-like protein n=1 Tax=Lasiosphaeris hirsuta TaxID=260670 RepID=A0AA40AQZ7_9PEZI|nr:ubiquitin-conjugating enzyme/RWD-like protein [Lasiosphaeris hirsuta]
MAAPKINSKSPTIRRILREAQELSTSPSADYTATPLETDLFEWHFTLRGPPRSAYAGGIYHGRIVLPPAYPLKPPSFRFVTPSGRFETNREICLSISGHHEETWQPAWGLRTALVALRSFMETDPRGQLGGLETTDVVRQRLAAESVSFRCAACGRTNADIMAECGEAAREHDAAAESDRAAARDVEVPSELKMGWRDEMEKAGAAEPAASGSEGPKETETEDAESAELAEGFVQTAPPPTSPAPLDRAADRTAVLPARPAQDAPQPARTVPPPDPQQHRAVVHAPLQQQARISNDGVPAWIDRLIVILGVLLVAMLVKVLMA